jgi:uncharacterized protein (DUF1810 family)
LDCEAETAAYWEHAVLGARLDECCALVVAVEQLTAHQLVGSPSGLTLRSSMTLFAAALPQQPVFQQVLERYCGGEPDVQTLALVTRMRQQDCAQQDSSETDAPASSEVVRAHKEIPRLQR